MPTTRRRHLVTESDALARRLDDAAKRWPQDRAHRGRLLLRLVDEGHRALARGQERRTRARRQAVARTSGVLSQLYGPGYLEELKRDWPN